MQKPKQSVLNRHLTPELRCRTKKLCADIVREVLAPAMNNQAGKGVPSPSADISAEERFKTFKRVMHGHVWPAPEVVGFSGHPPLSRSYSVQKWLHGGKRDFVKCVRKAALLELSAADYEDYDLEPLRILIGDDGARFCRLLHAEDAAMMEQRMNGMEADLATIDRKIRDLNRTKDAFGEMRYRIDLYDNSYEAVICGGKAGWLWTITQ